MSLGPNRPHGVGHRIAAREAPFEIEECISLPMGEKYTPRRSALADAGGNNVAGICS